MRNMHLPNWKILHFKHQFSAAAELFQRYLRRIHRLNIDLSIYICIYLKMYVFITPLSIRRYILQDNLMHNVSNERKFCWFFWVTFLMYVHIWKEYRMWLCTFRFVLAQSFRNWNVWLGHTEVYWVNYIYIYIYI